MILEQLYNNPKSPAGYTGEQALYKLAKQSSKKVKLQDVRDWLRKQQTYTLHKPIRKKFLQHKTVVAGIDTQWQEDLADLSKLSKSNDNHRYLLCIIDVFSKYAWVVPINDKSGKTLVSALKSVVKSGQYPKKLQTYKGTEFENKEFQNLLKNKKIHSFTTENPETKARIVERFQRTLKTHMWKCLTYNRTLRYVDILPKLVHGYIHAYFRSIKFLPVSVTLKMNHRYLKTYMANQILKNKTKIQSG